MPAVTRKKAAKAKRNSPPKDTHTTDRATDFAELPPDATDREIEIAMSAWFRKNHATVTSEGVVQSVNPDHTVPQFVQRWMDNIRPQIERMGTPTAARTTQSTQQLLRAKRKSPPAETETENENTSGTTESAPTEAEEMDANTSGTAENAPIEINGCGNTVEDPIIIDDSDSNSDSNSEKEADNNPMSN